MTAATYQMPAELRERILPLQEPRVQRIPAGTSREGAFPAVPALNGACIRRAVCQKDLVAAYRFVRKSRVALGYPAPEPAILWPDPADGPREIATFVAKAWPDVVGTTSLLLDSQDQQLPADIVFPELGEVRQPGRLVAELTNRATVPAYFRTNAPNDLIRCCVAHGQFVGCSDLLAVIRPWEQAGFVALGFRQVGPVRSSGGAVPEPVALARLDLLSLQADGGTPRLDGTDLSLLWQFYLKANPYIEHVKAWAALIEKETQAGRIGPEAEAVLADDGGAESEALKAAV
jgi:hypothetical protein